MEYMTSIRHGQEADQIFVITSCTCSTSWFWVQVGMANTKPKTKPTSFTMRTDQEFLARLDDVRAAQRPIKSRADMIRALVDKEWVKKKP